MLPPLTSSSQAGQTRSSKLDRVLSQLKTSGSGVGQGYLIERAVFEIYHLSALQAHHVMVPMCLSLEAGGRSRVTNLADDAEPHQGLENSINRSSGDPRDASTDIFEDLIRRRVILSAGQDFQNGSPLHRNRQTLLPAESLERLQLFGHVGLLQDATLSQTRIIVKLLGRRSSGE
jgi:hypothetical protein